MGSVRFRGRERRTSSSLSSLLLTSMAFMFTVYCLCIHVGSGQDHDKFTLKSDTGHIKKNIVNSQSKKSDLSTKSELGTEA